MKTAISVPDPIFEAAEALAERLGLSRSALYSRALELFLEGHRMDGVTERLNRVYSDYEAEPDPVLSQIQLQNLAKEDW